METISLRNLYRVFGYRETPDYERAYHLLFREIVPSFLDYSLMNSLGGIVSASVVSAERDLAKKRIEHCLSAPVSLKDCLKIEADLRDIQFFGRELRRCLPKQIRKRLSLGFRLQKLALRRISLEDAFAYLVYRANFDEKDPETLKEEFFRVVENVTKDRGL